MSPHIDGVRVGHWTDPVGKTGCTVILFPPKTVASGEVRGGAPATREFALLSPERTVENIHGLLLTGGSAFGLAAADGVVSCLEEDGMGFPTPAGPVPIVVAMSLYDLMEGDATVRPNSEHGRMAVREASSEIQVGQVGAGTGATVGKWRSREHRRSGGIGLGVAEKEEIKVVAIAAVNALGEPDDGTASKSVLNGTFMNWPEHPSRSPFSSETNTTLISVITNAKLSKMDCFLLSQSGHDGLARALFPPHLSSDGDAVVAAATGQVSAPSLDIVRALTVAAVEQAIQQSC